MTALSDDALAGLRGALAEPDLSGTRYELRGALGRGGTATVYRAFDTLLEREVALKVLDLPEADPTLAERILREARILAGLEHPGIVPVHDAGTLPDGRVFCAMKRVEGQRLDRAITTLALAERLRLFLRICEAVAFAHARDVVHRDLKPENVMVGAFGEVLVVDWGLAKSIGTADEGRDAEPAAVEGSIDRRPRARRQLHQQEQKLTGEGTVLGTPGYMAPEQVTGPRDAVGPPSDVFALGGVLHFLLAGEPPFATRIQPRAGVPKALAAVRDRALAELPESRYRSAGELAAEIERFLDGRPVTAFAESWLERSARLFTRYQGAVLLIVAYLFARLLILLFARL